MRARSNPSPLETLKRLSRTYKTPFALGAVFVALIVIFAIAPRTKSVSARGPQSTAEATPGPHECVVCGVDKQCDPRTGQCIFIDHTPLPCVASSHYDDKAGFCLPEGVPAAPAAVNPAANGVRTPTPPRLPNLRRPRQRQGGAVG
jgi:hypothetical protein